MEELWITPMCCPCGESAGFTRYGFLKNTKPDKIEIKCNECGTLLTIVEIK